MTPPTVLLVLLLTLGGLAAFLLLVCFAPLVGGLLTLLCALLGQVAGMLAGVADQVAGRCQRVLEATLRWGPPTAVSPYGADSSYNTAASPWPGLIVVSRLVGLAVALCIFVAEFTLGSLRSASVQTGGEGGVASPLPVGVASGLLWLAVAALWGMLLFELLEVVPAETHLFPRLAPRVRTVGTVVALVGFGLTVLSVGLLYLDGQLMVDGYTWPLAGDILSTLQGVLLAAITLVAAWALVLGIVALISVACALLQLVFATLSVLLRLLDRVAPQLGALSAGVIGLIAAPGRSLLGLPEGDEFATSPPASLAAPAGPHAALLTADHAVYAAAAAPRHDASPQRKVASSETEAEDPMTDSLTYRTTTLLGIDRAGARFLPQVRSALDLLGGCALLRAQGICDISRLSDAPRSCPTRGGVLDIGTTQAEVRESHAEPGGAERVTTRAVAGLVDRLVEVSVPAALGERLTLWIQDVRSVATSAPSLRDLKRRLPHHTRLVVGFLPEADRWDEQLKDGWGQLAALREDGVIAATLLVDVRSPLALLIGEEAQELLLARALACSLVAHLHDDRNPSFVEQVVRLGARSPFVAASLGSVGVVNGAPSARWYEPMRRIARGPVVRQGSLVDTRAQAKRLTQQLLQDESFRIVGAPLCVETPPLFVSYSVPMRLTDTRFHQFSGDMRPWLAAEYPALIASVVQGQGNRGTDRRNASSYTLHGSCFYGIGPLEWARPELGDLSGQSSEDPVSGGLRDDGAAGSGGTSSGDRTADGDAPSDGHEEETR